MTTYRMSIGWKIMSYALCTTSFALGLSMIVFPALEGGNTSVMPYLTGVGSLMMLLGLYLGGTAFKWSLIIGEDAMTEYGLFTTIHLAFADIKGYTVNQNFIGIIPVGKNKATIKLYGYIAQREELADWVATNFTMLDIPGQQAYGQISYIDENHVLAQDRKLEKLEQAHKVTTILNTLAGVLVCWAFIYPKPYQWASFGCLLLPILALIPYYYYHGIIKLDDTQSNTYPVLLGALLVTPLGLMIRVLKDFNLLAHTHIWTPTCVFAALFMAALYLNRRAINTKNKQGLITGTFTTVVVMAYGYGACVLYNCYFDESVPGQYRVVVLEKIHSSSIANNSYNLNMAPWGPVKRSEEYQVEAELYDDITVGDTVNLYLKEGRLHAPWVEIRK